MKKSSKFSKFLTIFSVFAMVLTVGFIPTVAKASETSGVIPPDSMNVNGYRLTVVVETLEYGEWTTKLSLDVPSNYDDYGRTFTLDSNYVDHADENFRIRFIYEYRSFLKTNTYLLDNYFELYYGPEEYFMSYAKMNVYTSRDSYKFMSVYSNVSLSENYPEFSAYVTPYVDCSYICIEFVSNIHAQFQTQGVEQSYFMVGSGGNNITFDVFVPQYPDLNLPDADVDGLHDFSAYAPSGELQAFLDSVFRYRFITIGMLMLVTMGVFGFLLFGERK